MSSHPPSPRVRRLLSVALLALVGACGDAPLEPAPADPVDAFDLPTALAVTSNGWVPFPLVVQKCGGEVVAVDGEKHEVFRSVRDDNDGVHVGYHLNFLLKGESASGVQYHYAGNQNSQIYLRYPSTSDMTELRVRMRAQGKADDLIFILRIHFVMDANGEIHVDYRAESEECGRGASGGTPSA